AAGGSIIPLTVLHHNDSHGRLVPTTALDSKGNTLYYQGYTQLATLIKQERAHNPNRNVLLNGGDSIQGDSMEYYFKSAGLGYAADGTPLPASLQMNPFIAAMNAMNYTAMTLGNHEFNFGSDVFTSTFKSANFPVLQANVSDTGAYGLAKVNVQPYTTVTLDSIKVAILGLGNHRVPNYELPSNIPGLTFTNPISTALQLTPGLNANNDVVIALTHIGFTTNPKSVEVDSNVDTNLAAQVPGLDVIVGSHSHTDPSKGEGDYKYLPTFVAGPNGEYVMVTQAYRYNTYLGEVVLGLRAKQGGGYEIVTRAGRNISVTAGASNATPEDPTVKAILAPYVQKQNQYNATYVGSTSVPIDTLKAFTQETNGANLQADAAVWELAKRGVPVDFHLSGAMTNKLVADTATAINPTAMTVADMFAAMPYENSLLALRMNGPQLKAVLERAYRNYYYYKYVQGFGGYSYYTTCMIDTNSIGKIAYKDTYPTLPDGNNVLSLVINGKPVDFADASKYYVVSTVNYLAAGSCNFNNNGVSLWPLDQIVADTQYYVRDAVIDYLAYKGKISPIIEGRIQFPTLTNVTSAGVTQVFTDTTGMDTTISIPSNAVTQTFTLAFSPISTKVNSQTFSFAGHAFDLDAYQNGSLVTGFTFAKPVTITIRYTDAEVKGLNENALMLNYWDGSKWADAACGAYDRSPDTNTFSAPICHLTKFAVFTTPLTYLPFSAKNAH
ncbi:MAG TPA: bifunctional UDP-sugar hydrolase/5'-nucleotidase, partial [Anaerolineales bacterium]